MRYRRMPIEIESPEQLGYETILCNLTESSFSDAVLADLHLDLDGLVLRYGDHRGHPRLRELIAASQPGVSPEDVLVTAGAASALFILATSLLEPGDRLLVAKPNYATNIETPRALGACLDLLELRFEEGFRVDLAELERRLTPETKLVSLTAPHNPTGVTMSEADLRAVVRLVEERGCRLLLDETYGEMAFGRPLPCAAALSPRAVSVSSLSKTFGLPGIRIGWLITKDPELRETLLAAKEQILICNSVVDEEIALRFLERKAERLPAIREKIAEHFGIVKAWLAGEPALEWVEPAGGVVCFPRAKASIALDVDLFYRILNEKYKTHVGPGHWFEMDRRHMRIGYGWPKTPELREGLANISKALAEARA